jgi:Zn finger protein HypA/HybF involved in hydrogenase expression
MHELSIAEALLELARKHVPDGAVLKGVSVRVGRMRAIDEPAMDLAWRAVTEDAPEGAVKLEMQFSPWKLQCPACGRLFDADDYPADCVCGQRGAMPVGTDELQLLSIDVD